VWRPSEGEVLHAPSLKRGVSFRAPHAELATHFYDIQRVYHEGAHNAGSSGSKTAVPQGQLGLLARRHAPL
jgi:hypothetical protein